MEEYKSKLTPKGRRWEQKANLERLTEWASKGLTLSDIAKNMGIKRCTLSEWRDKSPLILEALELGMEATDEVIEGALFKKAQGFQYPEITETFDKDGNLIDRKVVTKTALPDSRALVFWLKNRRPEKWNMENKVPEVKITADDGFFKALNNTAEEDWKDIEDIKEKEAEGENGED